MVECIFFFALILWINNTTQANNGMSSLRILLTRTIYESNWLTYILNCETINIILLLKITSYTKLCDTTQFVRSYTLKD